MVRGRPIAFLTSAAVAPLAAPAVTACGGGAPAWQVGSSCGPIGDRTTPSPAGEEGRR
jgi:hypothetical protein